MYLIRDSVIRPITQDHTYVAELVKGGIISSNEALNHPDKNKITRALGFKENYLPDFYREAIKENDIFVFCTDGLYEHLSDDEIREIILKGPIEEASSELIKAVNQRGGNDNVTVIVPGYRQGKCTNGRNSIRTGIIYCRNRFGRYPGLQGSG